MQHLWKEGMGDIKGLDPKPFLLSRDAACTTELLKHFVHYSQITCCSRTTDTQRNKTFPLKNAS